MLYSPSPSSIELFFVIFCKFLICFDSFCNYYTKDRNDRTVTISLITIVIKSITIIKLFTVLIFIIFTLNEYYSSAELTRIFLAS